MSGHLDVNCLIVFVYMLIYGESDDFACEWDESKRRNTRNSRGTDFVYVVLFVWYTALTRTDNAEITAKLGCPPLAFLKIVSTFAYGVGGEML